MTLAQLAALPVGTVVKDVENHELGEIIATGAREVTIVWPESKITVFVGLTKTWEEVVACLEIDE
jgi:hypothetical protein